MTQLEHAGITENITTDIVGHDKPRITYGIYSAGASLKQKAQALEKVAYEGSLKKSIIFITCPWPYERLDVNFNKRRRQSLLVSGYSSSISGHSIRQEFPLATTLQAIGFNSSYKPQAINKVQKRP